MKRLQIGLSQHLLFGALLCAVLGFLALATTPARASIGGRQDILLLPFTISAPNAPFGMANRIYDTVQAELVDQLGIQANQVNATSPMLYRARNQSEDEGKDLIENYNIAVDTSKTDEERVTAIGKLVSLLKVDAIIYGNVDQYECSSSPDPHQTMIHVTLKKVTIVNDTPLVMPMVVIGKSQAVTGKKFNQADLDSAAIKDASHELAYQITGRQAGTVGAEMPKEKKPRLIKTAGGFFWFVLSAAVAAASAL
ncbi:MAG TPA: hypothetical protein VGM23_16260 [Armatimonadota bacterium]|jgi:hypothetical protein